jgi:hypothetical protein
MNCRLKQTDKTNEQGWHEYVCERCGRGNGSFTPHDPRRWASQRECPAWPERWEAGAWLSLILAACFIRKADYLWLKRKLGLSPKCGCGEREVCLNRVGAWVGRWTARNNQWQ